MFWALCRRLLFCFPLLPLKGHFEGWCCSKDGSVYRVDRVDPLLEGGPLHSASLWLKWEWKPPMDPRQATGHPPGSFQVLYRVAPLVTLVADTSAKSASIVEPTENPPPKRLKPIDLTPHSSILIEIRVEKGAFGATERSFLYKWNF